MNKRKRKKQFRRLYPDILSKVEKNSLQIAREVQKLIQESGSTESIEFQDPLNSKKTIRRPIFESPF